MPKKLSAFLEGFNNFKDKRLKRRFDNIVRGIVAARTSRILTIAANSPQRCKNALYTAKGIYRFLSNARTTVEEILSPYYQKVKTALSHEKEVVVALDFSPIEKPYARKMEGLSRVRKKDKSGETNGYMMLSALALGKNKAGIAYASLYSQKEMESQNLEVRKAMKHLHRLFPKKRIIWVFDRQFDDQKNFWDVIRNKKRFICRVYHNRLVEVGYRRKKLLDWGRALPKEKEFETEMFIGRKLRKVIVALAWGHFTLKGQMLWLLRSEIVYIEGMKNQNKVDYLWWLVTNIPLRDPKIAIKVWQWYRKRWGSEDFYKFLKESLGLEKFQVVRLKEIEKLTALMVVAAAFIYDFGVSLDDGYIQLLLDLGGWTRRNKPGKRVLLRGLSMVATYLAVRAWAKESDIDESQLGLLF